MVVYHVVYSLSYDVMLGFDWLHTCSPHIDLWSYTLSVKVHGGHPLLISLPCNFIAHVEVASLDSVCKEISHGNIA